MHVGIRLEIMKDDKKKQKLKIKKKHNKMHRDHNPVFFLLHNPSFLV